MAEYTTITTEQLKQKIEEGEEFVLIDTLGEDSYRKAHLPGATVVDGHADDFVEKAKELVDSKDEEIIVYCSSFSCKLSPACAQKLADAGFTNVIDFEGGLKDWVEHGNQLKGEQIEEVTQSLTADSK